MHYPLLALAKPALHLIYLPHKTPASEPINKHTSWPRPRTSQHLQATTPQAKSQTIIWNYTVFEIPLHLIASRLAGRFSQHSPQCISSMYVCVLWFENADTNGLQALCFQKQFSHSKR